MHARLRKRLAHAAFVDEAHVEHLESDFVNQALLSRIHAAYADLSNARRLQRGYATRYVDEMFRAITAQTGDRHAVNVPARREYARNEVRMRIQP